VLIIVVADTHLDQYEELFWQFGGWPEVRIVLDRREAERLEPSDTFTGIERRRAERRRHPDLDLTSLVGLWPRPSRRRIHCNDPMNLLTDLQEFVSDHRPTAPYPRRYGAGGLDRVVMASSQPRPSRAHHASPDDPYDRAPPDQDGDHDDRQDQHHVADASQRVLFMSHVWPQTVTPEAGPVGRL